MILTENKITNTAAITYGLFTNAFTRQILTVVIISSSIVLFDPKRLIIFGTIITPKIAITEPREYKSPRYDSGMNCSRNDELLYKMSAVWRENINPILYNVRSEICRVIDSVV
jgi:hypothetical protein